MQRTMLIAGGMAATLWACGDAQTGADYPGEPLMSLRGVVVSSEQTLASDVVPAVIFRELCASTAGQEHRLGDRLLHERRGRGQLSEFVHAAPL